MNQYEAMYLFDPTFGASFEQCEGEVRRLMDRAEAELLFCKKWDERRLAYRVDGRKRGVYVLTYFKSKPEAISGIERDAKLSEDILRVLILRADDVSKERMEQWGSTHGESRGGDLDDLEGDAQTGGRAAGADASSGQDSTVKTAAPVATATADAPDKTNAGSAEA